MADESVTSSSTPSSELTAVATRNNDERRSVKAIPSSDVLKSLPLPNDLGFGASVPATVDEGVDFEAMLQEEEWDKMTRTVHNMVESESMAKLEASLSRTSENGDTILHSLVWKAPTHVTLVFLDSIPENKRDFYLLARDELDQTPLHLACLKFRADSEVSVILALLEMAPSALRKMNAHGDMPAHLILASPCFRKGQDLASSAETKSVEILAALLRKTPGLATRQNLKGASLLHCSIANKNHELVMISLLLNYPELTHVTDMNHMLPLHFVAAFGDSPWTFCQALINTFPKAVVAQSITGDTPLHLLLSGASKVRREKKKDEKGDEMLVDRNTTKIAELLVKPLSVKQLGLSEDVQQSPLLVLNDDDLSPLHFCGLFEVASQVTRILMSAPFSDEASLLTNTHGSTPLHLACSKADRRFQDSVQNVKELAKEGACMKYDNDGYTPLMIELKNERVSGKVVNFLLDCCPEAASLATTNDYLPLHMAVDLNIKESILKALIKAYPNGLEDETKEEGNLALHLACKNPSTAISTVALLLERYPRARGLCNNDGNTPSDLVGDNEELREAVPELFSRARSQSPSVRQGFARSKSPSVRQGFARSKSPSCRKLTRSSSRRDVKRGRQSKSPSARRDASRHSDSKHRDSKHKDSKHKDSNKDSSNKEDSDKKSEGGPKRLSMRDSFVRNESFVFRDKE